MYPSLVQPIAGGYERAVGGIHLLPVQGDCAKGLIVCLGRHIIELFLLRLADRRGAGNELLNCRFVFLFCVPGLTVRADGVRSPRLIFSPTLAYFGHGTAGRVKFGVAVGRSSQQPAFGLKAKACFWLVVPLKPPN